MFERWPQQKQLLLMPLRRSYIGGTALRSVISRQVTPRHYMGLFREDHEPPLGQVIGKGCDLVTA